VTWGSGATGVKGEITRANSLIGEKENDALGAYYLALMNGNYVVANPTLDVGGVINAGGASWVDGSTGRLNDYVAQGNQNIMSAANALVVGYAGAGSLTVADGARVTSASGVLGYASGASGTATLNGANTVWRSDELYVGYLGLEH